ncbi:MAG: LpxD N-terminal domain-containing protein [Saprospiraceae bacterium]|nr:UDP-3-O-(3-hydroxymyristoyl)glucosamine N-acyltransferase [Saprospiraceae bacterium]MDC3253903.1 UDP-3-O-(3-hydroxymyristoyl)glucosamine N-acyltransferase [bacterium]MDG1434697.1 LpxD N-terminal domain-containing protein [Saprospiraceae bacterium]MDG2418563.1 LpxD N-terminal domain-containing protein [Saprospiraceae bacterium]
MKFKTPIPILAIAGKYHCEIIGDNSIAATGINEIHKVEIGDITFVDIEKYFQKSLNSSASIIILNKRVNCPPGKALLFCDQPFEVYNKIIKSFRPFEPLNQEISDRAIIHPSAIIEPNVMIAPNVKIGKYTYIQSNVIIHEHTFIGDHCVVNSGSVIGTDAFYFKRNGESFKKWRSGGRVIIEDRVDIGAACTISKGVSGDTIIGEGSKLDCQVHIGHGVIVGKNCLFAAQVGIGGKTVIEDNVTLYGQVGVAQSIRIGAKAIVLAKSGVSKTLEGGKTYFGAPAIEARQYYREMAAVRMLAKK